VVATAALPPTRLHEVRSLLDAAFDGDFSDDDWYHTIGGTHVMAVDEDRVVAHASVVARALDLGGRVMRTGYVEGVAAAPGRRGEGLGSSVMGELSAIVRDRFELGALSTDRHTFYERLGWERWRGPTFVRRAGGLDRSEEEDDGVMVLRFGASVDVDLAGPIICEERPGDDW
jgi:aminoglycoside 2'-N-acetyltransferase I